MTNAFPRRAGWIYAAVAASFGVLVSAFTVADEARGQAQAQAQQSEAKIPNERMEQLVAPIALYPDSLLAQVFMASTYPLEIVQADRWAKANPKLKGKALEEKLVAQPWDTSVKSLVTVPQVLTMMSEKLDWTERLGSAFLAQQEDALAAVQRLRAKADNEGKLKTTPQQKVSKQTQAEKSVIVIEPANPQVVYVPTYNPSTVYGAWPYPAYPPYAWYPPGYIAGGLISFGIGAAVGGALWGNCNWGGGNVNINVDRHNNFNRTNISNGNWQHNSAHRKGAPYSNSGVANRYGKGATNTAAREQFRGRAESGNLGAGRDGASRPQGGRDGASRPQGGRDSASRPQSRESGGNRGSGGGRQQAGGGSRPSGGNSMAFSGAGNGGAARAQSSRGQASRQASNIQHRAAPRPSAGRGGGGGRSFSGGGGGRGGGGRGGRR